MAYLLMIYFIFLGVYIIFNVYAILKVLSLRISGDQTKEMLIIYMAVVSFLILISLIIISGLSWTK